ncbi:TPA: hypothetical protein ACOQZT_000385 [Serratia odorifera]|uniref:hypothetical protein n=1 Tax=Serratia odorifera TaxID=618 RepID=UPI003532379F
MSITSLTDEEAQQLESIKSAIGHCVITLLSKQKAINTANILSQIVNEMEKATDETEFRRFRASLEIVGTSSFFQQGKSV